MVREEIGVKQKCFLAFSQKMANHLRAQGAGAPVQTLVVDVVHPENLKEKHAGFVD